MDRLNEEEIDGRVREVLTVAIREAGGPGELVRRHDQQIVPALVESAYAIVMKEEAGRSNRDIADFLGISSGAVESVFQAPMEAHLARMHYREDAQAQFDPHSDPERNGSPSSGRQEREYFAGAMAKFAYDIVCRERAKHH